MLKDCDTIKSGLVVCNKKGCENTGLYIDNVVFHPDQFDHEEAYRRILNKEFVWNYKWCINYFRNNGIRKSNSTVMYNSPVEYTETEKDGYYGFQIANIAWMMALEKKPFVDIRYDTSLVRYKDLVIKNDCVVNPKEWDHQTQKKIRGGILADEFGMGKTVTCTGILKGKTLIIVPPHIISQWEHELTIRKKPFTTISSLKLIDRVENTVITSYTFFIKTYKKYRNQIAGPIKHYKGPFMFHTTEWDRVILDDFHDYRDTPTDLFKSLPTKWWWFISATPDTSLKSKEFVTEILETSKLADITRRNTKKSVCMDVVKVNERIVHLSLTPKEKMIYERCLTKKERQRVLNYIGCAPVTIGTFEETRNNILLDLDAQIERLRSITDSRSEKKIADLEKRKTFIEKVKPDMCPVCLDPPTSPAIIKVCGHIGCWGCFKSWGFNKGCVVCKSSFKESDISLIDATIIDTHGSKMAYLIDLLKDGRKTVVYTYGEDTFKYLKKALLGCGITVRVCMGHTAQKQSAIKEFILGDTQVMLLSFINSASGANLTVASRIVFYDQYDGDPELVKQMEEQALGRLVRFGQNSSVDLLRLKIE